ncbi:ABC transporter permease [Acetoanaerobium noterae]|uniref:ABC transporter permease n=1 Tax=Acetoanaerobium noterae TaxID=745369 RepID=UPI00332A3142
MNAKSFINKLIYLGLIYLGITFIVYPIGNIFRISLLSSDGNLSLSQYIAFFSTPVMITALKNTIKVGILTVITCMLVGVFMAFYTQYYKTRFAKLINIILLTPFVLPGVIIVIAFIQLYSEMGIINQALKLLLNLEKPPIKFFGINGIIFVHTFTQYIYFYINTKIALRFLDYSAVESARSLGASKFKVFKDIIFPHLKPAILTSAFMTFATGVSSFSAPYLIGSGYRMMSTQILQSKMNNQMQMASVQVVLLMGISVITMLLYNFYSKQNIVAKNTRNINMKKVVIKNKSLSLAMNLCAYLIILFIITPILGIVVLSFADSSSWMMKIFPDEFTLENYKRIFLQKRILSPVKNSIQMSLIAAGGASLIAILSSYLFIKDKGFLSKVLNFLIITPMAIPASTLGVNLITAFNKKHILLFNNSLVGTYSILPIAYVIATITLVSRSTYTAFTNYNPEYDFASRNLGASNTQTFRWIFIPIVSYGIISGFSLAFMRSLGEYTISALLYGVHNKPLSIAMVNALHDFDIGISMAYGGIIILLGTVFLVLFSKTYD